MTSLLLSALVSVSPTLLTGSAAQEAGASGGIREVAQLPVASPPGLSVDEEASMGWLILNPTSRRGYQIFETGFSAEPFNSVIVQSFDLDTLALRRRVAFAGDALVTGTASGTNNAADAGEVFHAVDQKRGLVYIALANKAGTGSRMTSGADGVRPFSRIVVIDEAALDRGDAAFSATFREPVVQLPLHDYSLKSMQLEERGDHGRLLMLFADPPKTPFRDEGAYTHMLAAWRWDSTTSPLRANAPSETATQSTPVVDWASANPPQAGALPGTRVLESCRTVPVGGDRGRYRWELLVTPGNLHVVCQSGRLSAQVIRLPRNANGEPTGEDAQVRLGRFALDVLADPSSGRMFLREDNGQGETWWVFDSKVLRFVGSIASMLGSTSSAAAGLDPTTGRLYANISDHVFFKGAGTEVTHSRSPVRGGFQVVDPFIDPVPAFENVVPELAYPGRLRIQVDPVRRRLFMRRGVPNPNNMRFVYPETDAAKMVPAPVEPFYRVLEDRIPLATPPPSSGDDAFTTQVNEAPGLTQASFLGEGTGFGSRVLLTGGIAAATAAGPEADSGLGGDRSPIRACATVDRELVVAEATSASVSDLSASAAGSGFDADPTTEADMEDPAGRCWQMTNPAVVEWPGPNPEGYSFDANDDDIDDFLSECEGDESTTNQKVGSDRGFTAAADCKASEDRAEVRTTGAFSVTGLAGAGSGSAGATSSFSTVEVERPKDGGIKVVVTSEARGIELPVSSSARIDRVWVQAKSWAGGRKETAATSFERLICGVDLGPGNFQQSGCLTKADEQRFAASFNQAYGSSGRMQLREPDPDLAKGTVHGYRAGVIRDDLDRFTDQVIHRDSSLAIPGLEIIFFRGDSQFRGAGRQIYQFAAAQAATTYGIACVNGMGSDGGCAGGLGNLGDSGFGGVGDSFGTGATAGTGEIPGLLYGLGAGSSRDAGDPLGRFLRKLLGLPADLARLFWSSPAEFGLMMAMWLLLYWPCYAGERRRTLRRLAAGRMAGGMA
ncbi:MAG TPA: hypothetical protein VM938_11895 [Acidimicrobiales bacterium]|nr:hypothetical protein [Acidimicrobiales bacterium]